MYMLNPGRGDENMKKYTPDVFFLSVNSGGGGLRAAITNHGDGNGGRWEGEWELPQHGNERTRAAGRGPHAVGRQRARAAGGDPQQRGGLAASAGLATGVAAGAAGSQGSGYVVGSRGSGFRVGCSGQAGRQGSGAGAAAGRPQAGGGRRAAGGGRQARRRAGVGAGRGRRGGPWARK
ncbi:hypothetical protein GGX14DRAFT_383938 [Mycena pura]|uniref:Uncharacterized protein n=1 Tax=Mycena pura TaxID=153505 RepID=A0AAD6YV74_9AGAR|nr:hypothetical protein GGX14DRAFT_383938 [Mycena pura]